MMKSILTFLITALFVTTALSQIKSQASVEKTESPYELVNVKFTLEGNPTPEKVGFDNLKSYWQISYELRFLKDKDLLPAGFVEKENESPDERAKRVKININNLDKVWKKQSVSVIKGKVPKTQISIAGNREINIPVKLSPEILDVLAKAVDSTQIPYFEIKMKARVFTEIDSNLKLKDKVKIAFECPTKTKIGSKQEWMMNTCGVSTEITKEDGKIVVGLISRL